MNDSSALTRRHPVDPIVVSSAAPLDPSLLVAALRMTLSGNGRMPGAEGAVARQVADAIRHVAQPKRGK